MNKIISVFLALSILLNVYFIFDNNTNEIDATGSKISYSLSNLEGDPEQQLLDIINNSTESLDIAIYNLDDTVISEAILEANQRGVAIQIITDQEKITNEDSEEIFTSFWEAGIPIKINTETKMHLKLTIADQTTVVAGSFNYTDNSSEENQELLFSIENTTLATEWNDLFLTLWESDDYTYWTP
ncbi:phospholipase D-like domain-containing protein [Paraliobacillus sp. X-1268]|uniref:phospholipase D-like domain-containing protein n=1 Tax=Paraliobacillus sp. X-1268 TaxID=2213193 RepID=UPI000E3E77DD|nr:phospholipase D-like domain-containing protein [Paraliobacillus sp. X-1268]